MREYDPSRIPPRIAYRSIPVRVAIEEEITDLHRSKANETPSMVEVSLADSRYRQIPRTHSTLVAKSKSTHDYKGRLCVRADALSMNETAFASPPTPHRCCVGVICATECQLRWAIRAVDVSLAFLQSANMNSRDRSIASHPAMERLRWKGKRLPMSRDVN